MLLRARYNYKEKGAICGKDWEKIYLLKSELQRIWKIIKKMFDGCISPHKTWIVLYKVINELRLSIGVK